MKRSDAEAMALQAVKTWTKHNHPLEPNFAADFALEIAHKYGFDWKSGHSSPGEPWTRAKAFTVITKGP